jgi:hypothetical protein
VGLKVASYLVVGAFLFVVAYWYRAAGSSARAEPAAEPTT